jgi:hypothetical protein
MKNTEMEWLLLKSAPEPRMFQSAVSTAQVELFFQNGLQKIKLMKEISLLSQIKKGTLHNGSIP